jgi:putative Ca2+/H+ antiporter (TMEM165/GDT1 family)
MRTLLSIFVSIFVAELGDKTQLATLLFATDQRLSRAAVFLAASAALVLSTLIAVLVGDQLGRVVSPSTLRVVAAIGFIAIGLWMLLSDR